VHNSKLIGALRCLSPKQIKVLGDIVDSPFFNKDEDLVRFYSIIVAFAPRFSHQRLERAAFYTETFPQELWNEKKLSYLMSNLLKLIEQLLVQDSLKKQPLLSLPLILQGYLDWGLEKHYKGAFKEASTYLEKKQASRC